MIKISEKPLPAATASGLENYQEKVNAGGNYEERVSLAKELFPKKNKDSDPVFKVVRETLGEMCPGIHRCCYCEDSYADEVEHIQPKDLYPEKVFDWENYLYSCGRCNIKKSSKYAIINKSGDLIDITRKTGQPILPPPGNGQPAFINIRRQNPLDLIILNLSEPFMFVPRYPEGTKEYKKADYTVESVLKLNRDELVEARHSTFTNLKELLNSYRVKKKTGESCNHFQTLIRQEQQHVTVWEEMKRQKDMNPEIETLFKDIPEALKW